MTWQDGTGPHAVMVLKTLGTVAGEPFGLRDCTLRSPAIVTTEPAAPVGNFVHVCVRWRGARLAIERDVCASEGEGEEHRWPQVVLYAC